MAVSQQLLFFFSALGVFNGLLLSIYLLLSKPARLSKRWLALLLFAVCVRISKSIWFYFDPAIGKQFLQIGLSACFFIGPLLYFYVQSVVRTTRQNSYINAVHLGSLVALVFIFGTLYPYQTNIPLWNNIVYKVINWQWLVYLCITTWLIWPSIQQRIFDKGVMPIELRLALNVFCGVFLIWLAYFTASYTSYIVGALSFSFMLYLTAILWFSNKFTHVAQQASPQIDSEDKTTKYVNKIPANEAQRLMQQLTELMTRELLFKEANLSLPKLAKKLGVSVPTLSQLLNDNMNSSFAAYVNTLRIENAKTLLISDKKLTMELIAERCGYNSLSTFYSAFKHITDSTPAKYRKQHLQP